MNLKEEINNHTFIHWLENESLLHFLYPDDAERIAESYARDREKQRAWETWRYLMLGETHPIKEEWTDLERKAFEQWYSQFETPTGEEGGE